MTVLGIIVLAFVALMLLTTFVLAIVFQRWFLALGIVGFVVIGGLWFRASSPMPTEFPQPPRGARAEVRVEEEIVRAPAPPSSPPSEISRPKTEILAEANEPTTPRPAWIDQSPRLRSGVYEVVAKSGPWATPGECQRALEAAEAKAAEEYMDAYIGAGAGKRVSLEPEYIRTRLQTDEFDETIQASVGVMHQAHARLAFDATVREELRARWRQATANERLRYVGAGAAATLLVIGSAYSYLVAANRRAARIAGATRSA